MLYKVKTHSAGLRLGPWSSVLNKHIDVRMGFHSCSGSPECFSIITKKTVTLTHQFSLIFVSVSSSVLDQEFTFCSHSSGHVPLHVHTAACFHWRSRPVRGRTTINIHFGLFFSSFRGSNHLPHNRKASPPLWPLLSEDQSENILSNLCFICSEKANNDTHCFWSWPFYLCAC